jgi:hypothetical protein
MTRINVAILPKELPDKLLLAEHREITRIPNSVKSGRANLTNIPMNFTLGTGHVKFFYNKLLYLKNRYVSLYKECVLRGFNVTSKLSAFEDIPENLLNGYEETQEDRMLLVQRIHSKGFGLRAKIHNAKQEVS